ncbi:hypothetical protein [Falsibacillus albus]|uniref:Uncharacterized protein n=1 Tax=Falsibacillus albus TaxID=2478915 RepID=A0A3L7K5A1_9BACI|nr:hypothetical protein [Falsibacillus albus]RLQ97459.1 hypothetical protein D9X91_04725 [Falsibacillus albus]
MKRSNIIRMVQMTVPWLSVVFLPKNSIRRYLPVSILASLLVTGMCLLAVPYKWWKVMGGWKIKIFNDLSFILGPFFVGTLWIFHFSFGNFLRYFFLNLIMDSLFSYPLNYLYQRLNLYKLINFKPSQIFMSFFGFSIIIYLYQHIVQRVNNITK